MMLCSSGSNHGRPRSLPPSPPASASSRFADTRPFAGLADQYRGADVLIHEVYSVRGFANRPAEWQQYHSNVHTSAHELAALANDARPGLLVLTHQLFWGVTEAALVAEVQAQYDGPVVSGRDLDVY